MAVPLVSVVMPVRNGGDWLAESVGSILGQSLPDLELILVDDHSDDGAVGALALTDSRLKRLASPARGVSAAFNAGLAAASGRFVARMDADDWMLRDRLRAQRAALEREPGLAGVGCHVRLFPRSGLRDGRRRYERWLGSIATADP